MHPLARAAELEEGAPKFSQAERRRIMAFKIPGDEDYNRSGYIPQKLYRKLQEYYKEHEKRLAALIRATG